MSYVVQVRGAMTSGTGGIPRYPGFGHDHDTLDLRFPEPMITENRVFRAAAENSGW
jgi:hypothetical protein